MNLLMTLSFLLWQRGGRYYPIEEEYSSGLPEGNWFYIQLIVALILLGFCYFACVKNNNQGLIEILTGFIGFALISPYLRAFWHAAHYYIVAGVIAFYVITHYMYKDRDS